MPTMQREESGRSFEPAPEGQFVAVLCDIVDLGHFEVTFEGESKGVHPHIRFAWQIEDDEQQDEEGRPKRFLVNDKRMKRSFHEKSTLTKRLSEWLGAKTLKEMLEREADFDELIGKCALVTVEHSERNGTVYANVVSVAALPKKMPAIEVENYVRQQERDSWADKQPEYSAYIKLTDAQKRELLGTPPEPRKPVERGNFMPEAGEMDSPRRSLVPDAVAGRARAQQQQRETVKALAKDTPEDDETDPFDGE